MDFVFTTSVLASNESAEVNRLRDRLAALREARRQQRAERYVAHMPTAVLGAC